MIDASGRGALLSRKFDLRVDEPRLANVAVFSHYSGVPRQEGRRAGDIRIVARADLGWFWLIPISERADERRRRAAARRRSGRFRDARSDRRCSTR